MSAVFLYYYYSAKCLTMLSPGWDWVVTLERAKGGEEEEEEDDGGEGETSLKLTETPSCKGTICTCSSQISVQNSNSLHEAGPPFLNKNVGKYFPSFS